MDRRTENRHAVREAVLPLMHERGYANVSFVEAAEAAGLSEAQLADLFPDTREIVTGNDYFSLIVSGFRESSPELSCASAWMVAIEELAVSLNPAEWASERVRIEIYAREENALGGAIAEISGILMGLNDAVAERSGLPLASTPVSVFSGTVLGTMLSMPLAFYPDAHTWVAAHAVAIDELGPSLDHMLRTATVKG